MAKYNELKLNLPSLEDLFSTEQSREDEKREKVYDISLVEIDDFPNHPFKVIQDNTMQELIESIRFNGVMTPVILRQKETGRYEMISGHRRKKACEYLDLNTIPAVIRNITRDEAIIMMVDANLQREVILPSEKAFSYKMRLEAMNRQGKRPDLTLSPLGTKLRSDERLAQQIGDSRNQIQRFIRLTELIPELLHMVDDKQLGFRSGVEISYLNEEEQKVLLKVIQDINCLPSLSQTTRIKMFSQENTFNEDEIYLILTESKKNTKEKVVLKDVRFDKYFPKIFNTRQKEDLLVDLLEKWYRDNNGIS